MTVAWKLATDPALHDVVSHGTARAEPEHDFTVKVTPGGLTPATTYWYGFEAGGVCSPVGRTRTAPAGPVERLRVGVVSCAHWSAGFFNAYGNLARRDVDVVLHLGDYLYEGRARDPHGVRLHNPPGRLLTRADYRARHAQYKTDPDLRALHRAHPVVAVWDDHELGSNCWRTGAVGHRDEVDGPWADRVAAAVGAYREWMPVPPVPPGGDPLELFRTARFGDLCDLVITDTRLFGRERPPTLKLPTVGLLRRDRSLLGESQWRWLETQLPSPDGGAGVQPRWRLLGSQVVVAPIHLVKLPAGLRRLGRCLGASGGGLVVNPGQWDGYPDERDRLLALLGQRPGETVVLSGDLHSSWAAGLHDAGGRLVATELTTPAVSAPDFAGKLAPPVPGARRLLEWAIRAQNDHVRWVDTRHRGYLLLDVTPDRIEAEWWHAERVDRRTSAERCAARFTIHHGGGLHTAEHLEEPARYSSSRRRAATKAS